MGYFHGINDAIKVTLFEFIILNKDIEGFKAYEYYKDDWIYEWNKDVPWVHEKPWMDDGAWKEPAPVEHYCEPFNYKNGCSEWPTCSWRDDGYSLKDGKLKEEALKNKAIIEGIIKDEDNESSNEGWRRWSVYENTNHGHEKREYEMEHEDKEKRELFDDHERLICNIRRFEMIKYSFGQDEEYVVVKENKYDDLTSTSEDACRTYQEIFHMMDEGWMVTRAE
ncbi:hypothetical protein Tco_0449645 [Tanacetum coccineum]